MKTKTPKPLSPSARKVLANMYAGERARWFDPMRGGGYWIVQGGNGHDVRSLILRGFAKEVKEVESAWKLRIFAEITPEGRAYHEANPEAAPVTWFKVHDYGDSPIIEVDIIGHTDARVTLSDGCTTDRFSRYEAYYPTKDEAIDAIIAKRRGEVKAAESRLSTAKDELNEALKKWGRE